MSKLIRSYASTGDLPAVEDGAVASVAGTLYVRTAGAWEAYVPAGASPIVAGCTVAADATFANAKNVASVETNGFGQYTITLTGNTATKYAPLVSVTETDGFGSTLIASVVKTSATVWVVTTNSVSSGDGPHPFSFILFALD